MEIRISGQHMDLSKSLSEHVTLSLNKMSHKYKEHPVSAVVHFGKDGPLIKCDINFHDGSGGHKPFVGVAESDDAHFSFDKALTKLKAQIMKLKRKNKPKHNMKISELPSE